MSKAMPIDSDQARGSTAPTRPSLVGIVSPASASFLARWGQLLPMVLAAGAVALTLELVLPSQRAWLLPLGILELVGLAFALFGLARRWATLRGSRAQVAVEAASVLFVLLLAQAKVGVLVEVCLTAKAPAEVVRPGVLYTGAAVVVLLLGAAARMRPTATLAAILVASPSRTAVVSFASTIAAGSILLSLPVCVEDLRSVSFFDALFTATSAVCVTGLTVNDIPATYTRVGQGVILLLVQLGGIGIMTLGTTAAMVAARGLRVRQAATMAEMLDADSLSSVRRLVRQIVLVTLVVEGLGAGILYATFSRDPRTQQDAIFQAVFHAVSAFCNAGFSTLPQGLYPYQREPLVPLTVCGLILLGGIGFPVIDDVLRSLWARLVRRQHVRLRLHSRLALGMSALLVLLGTVLYLVLEARVSMASLPVGSRLLAALFQSVSARTAGFNLVDCGAMAPATLFFTMALMFVGASPASTGGGIKTTTLAVFLAALRSLLRGRSRVEVANRTLPELVLVRALTVAAGSVIVVGGAGFLLLIVDSQDPLRLLFEACSAFATVGLSTGITPSLSFAAKLLLIVVMLVGRVGPLTAALSLGEARSRQPINHPEERVLIG